MKILFLTDGIYPFQLGGMQKHSLILAKLLVERGLDLHIFHIGGEGYSSEALFSEFGENANKVSETLIPFPKTDPLPGHYIRENKKYSKLIYDQVRDKMDDYDLVYAQGFTAWYMISQKVKGRLKTPITVNFHGFEMFQKPPNNRVKLEYKLFKKAVKYNIRNADYVYSFGGQIGKIIQEIGIPEEKILLQSNGITKDWLVGSDANQVRNQKRTFIFIGRNERRKGIEELNIALSGLLKREELDFIFHFVGPIPKDAQLNDKRLEYHGEIREVDKIKDILHQSDVLVCPSHSEGMPTVILEGMASGLAILATDVGAVSRQIKNNGILLDEPNPEALQKALFELANCSVQELNQMKTNSIELIKKKFLWSVIADQKVKDFKKIIR
ncbi:MAG: glycosyltransferase involved in cell wall biosynthesis [Arenicella sp.]|jgi:glycosyltransferase involved in cell wall biosynthesis